MLLENFTDIVRENESVNATCVDVLSRDESVAEDFSALFYYLSTPKTKESISNVSDASTSFFSWYGSNGVASLSSNSVTSVMTALRSLYQYLLTWIQSNPNDADLPDVQKSVEITENLRSDLAELQSQVVGHVPRWRSLCSSLVPFGVWEEVPSTISTTVRVSSYPMFSKQSTIVEFAF